MAASAPSSHVKCFERIASKEEADKVSQCKNERTGQLALQWILLLREKIVSGMKAVTSCSCALVAGAGAGCSCDACGWPNPIRAATGPARAHSNARAALSTCKGTPHDGTAAAHCCGTVSRYCSYSQFCFGTRHDIAGAHHPRRSMTQQGPQRQRAPAV